MLFILVLCCVRTCDFSVFAQGKGTVNTDVGENCRRTALNVISQLRSCGKKILPDICFHANQDVTGHRQIPYTPHPPTPFFSQFPRLWLVQHFSEVLIKILIICQWEPGHAVAESSHTHTQWLSVVCSMRDGGLAVSSFWHLSKLNPITTLSKLYPILVRHWRHWERGLGFTEEPRRKKK